MKVTCALVQLNFSTDVEENVERAVESVREAGRNGARLICLPELSTTQFYFRPGNLGYPVWETEILYCEIDTDLSKRLREEWGFFRDRRPEVYSEVTAR